MVHGNRAAILVMLVPLGAAACAPDDPAPSPMPTDEQASACIPLSEDEIAVLLGPDGERWKGEGTFTPTGAQRAAVPGENEFFSGVIYLQGDSPDQQGQVYAFATTSEELTGAEGSLMGADPLTRERWAWGDVAQRGAPLEDAARDAVAAAPACLPDSDGS